MRSKNFLKNWIKFLARTDPFTSAETDNAKDCNVGGSKNFIYHKITKIFHRSVWIVWPIEKLFSWAPAYFGKGAVAFFQEIDPLPTQWVPPLYYIQISFFGDHLAPIYTNFEARAQPKKRDFVVIIVQKLPKNAIFGLFFLSFEQKIGAENLVKLGSSE